MESARVETHYKRVGGGVVSRPQLPPHQASPRSKRVGGGWGGGEHTLLSSAARFPAARSAGNVIKNEGERERSCRTLVFEDVNVYV